MNKSGVFAALTLVAWAALAGGPAMKVTYDPKLDGVKQLDQAGRRAAREHRQVFVVVGGMWCTWCRALDALVDANEQLRSELDRDFVVVHLNYSKENKNQAVLDRIGNPEKLGFPSFVVLSADLKVIKVQSSESFEIGDKAKPGHDPDKLIAFLTQHARKT